MEPYIFIKTLGKGNFGVVNLYQRKEDNKNVVIKEITLALHTSEFSETVNEVCVLKILRHPHIIQYYESFVENGSLRIVMEYARCGTLHDHLSNRRQLVSPLDQQDVLNFFCQILFALNHMHKNNILHRDLKPENIMLTGLNSNVVKVGDFGISKILEDHCQQTGTVIGTRNYMSPEVLNGKPYGFKADIWSLGCILYELCEMRRMFDGSLSDVVHLITTITVPKVNFYRYSPGIQELISELCHESTVQRPSTEKILAHQLIMVTALHISVDLGRVNFDI